MEIERNLIGSILKLTKCGCVPSVLISKEANIPSETAEKLLLKLQIAGLITTERGFVEATPLQRANLAIYAIHQGLDRLDASMLLNWQEFESVSAIAFEKSGYRTLKNYRFKQGGRKWEIDVIGFRKPLFICADCKHWRRGLQPSSLRKMTEEQIARAKALSIVSDTLLERLNRGQNERIIIIPIVLSLFSSQMKFCAGTPIVPISQLNDFLDQLPMRFISLFYVSKTWDNKKADDDEVKTSLPNANPASSFKRKQKKNRALSEFM